LRLWPLLLLGVGLPWPAAQAQALGEPQLALRPLQRGAAVLALDPVLRVLLQEGPQIDLAAAEQPLQLRDGAGQSVALLTPGQVLIVQSDPQQTTGLRLLLDGVSLPPLAGALWLEPMAPGSLVVLQQRRYRGRLQLTRQGTGLQAINHVSLESYLPSVVGSEMPASWPQPALRAQAVAARTYALRQRRPAEPFDLRATVSSQVYRGVDSETDTTREAVAATRSQVLTYGGSLIEAVFHSSSGGTTEASGDLWAQQLPYLVAVQDFDDHSPVRRWSERFGPDQLSQSFAETGGLLNLQVLSRTATGRLRQVRIEGPRASLVLSGAQLRQRLGLRSTLVELELVKAADPAASVEQGPQPPQQAQQSGLPLPPLPPLQWAEREAPAAVTLVISGRGFGHGIGMSQWGAYTLARRGADHGAILSHYYPGTQLDAYRGP
jgi:stage II sporulation protein D